jgi:hypothetical protein
MLMRKLLTTTALAIGLAAPAALPVAAQSTDTQTQTQGGQAAQQGQGMNIMVSSMIGRSLYMPSEGAMQGGDDTQAMQSNEAEMTDGEETEMAEGGTSGMTEEEQTEMAQGGVEGEAEELEQEAETELAEAGQEVENAAEQTGQAVETAAENTGQALENAGQELMSEVAEVPENWEMVGDIDDVIVTGNGEARAILVDSGGFLGAGETERRIDIENLRFVRDSDDEGEYYVVFAGDRSMFEEQQTYDQASAEEAGEMRATENEQFSQQVASEGRGMSADMEAVDWASITTEEVLGAAVYGSNDEWIGDLSEFVLAEDGNIQGVIIDVGGFLGIGEKPVEMSLDQVTLRRFAGDEIRAYVNATEEELDSMQEWTGDDL